MFCTRLAAVAASVDRPNQLLTMPMSSTAKLIQKAAKVPKIPATALWPTRVAHTVAMARKSPAEKKTIGIMPPPLVAVSR